MAKEETKANVGVGADSEVISISRGDLRALIQQEIAGGFKKPKRVTEHVARLRLYEGKPVVKYDGYNEVEENGKRVAYINIYPEGVEKPVRVKYLEFLNSDTSVQVKIVKQVAEETVKVEGKVRSKNPDEAHISSKRMWESNEVDLEVTSYTYMVTVEVLEGELAGKQFTLDSRALNA